MKKIFILLLVAGVFITGCSQVAKGPKILTMEEAKAKTVDFINNNLMQPGQEVSVKEVSEEDGLYKIVVNMSNNQEVISYLTKDGNKFFPQVMDIAEIESKKQEAAAGDSAPPVQAAADVPKAEKASVELFVMSHCPYGTQIEKGILPAIEALGDDVDFELKFCDYAMHGEKELKEQLNQYCIQKENPSDLLSYLECFLEADDGPGCLTKVGINKAKLTACVDATDKEYSVLSDFENKENYRGQFPGFGVYKDDNTKYGITGSPGLVINGTKISSGRDSATLLKNICAGYENPPEACDTELPSAAPSPGFGFGTTGSDTAAGCGS
jgi:glutaredoxin